MGTVSGFFPEAGSADDWNAAFYRLEDYLRAHGVTNKIHQSQIILRLIQRAEKKFKFSPDEDPTALAMREAYDEIDRWFQRVFPGEDLPPARLSSLGRVSMQLLDAPNRWPAVFLCEGELPEDFLAAMRDISIVSGPDLQVSTMAPLPLDEGRPSTGILETAIEQIDKAIASVM